MLKTTKQTSGGETNTKNQDIKTVKNVQNIENIEIYKDSEESLNIKNNQNLIMQNENKNVNENEKIENFNIVGNTKENEKEKKEENNEVEIAISIANKSYFDIAKDIIEKEGLGGLFGRGLQVILLYYCFFVFVFVIFY